MFQKMGHGVTEWESRPKENFPGPVLGMFWGCSGSVLGCAPRPRPRVMAAIELWRLLSYSTHILLWATSCLFQWIPVPISRHLRPVPFNLVVGWLAVWRKHHAPG